VPSEADQWLGVDRAATFRAHVEQLDAIEVRSEASLARLGTTWEHELVEVEKLYREAKTPAEAYYALLALTNSFHDGHAFLRVDGLEPTSPEVTVPLSVRVEYADGGARYVVRAGGALPEGVEVLSLDGRPVDELEADWRRWFPGNSPEGLREGLARWMSVRSPRREPSPVAGASLAIVARAPGGPATSSSLTWAPRVANGGSCPLYAEPCTPDADGEYSAAPSFVGLGYCVYDAPQADTRIVRYRTFSYPDTTDRGDRACLTQKLPGLSYRLSIAEADRSGPRGLLQKDQGALLDHLARRGVRRVLFDVRENTGGDFDPVFFGAFTTGSYAQPLKRFVYRPWFRADPSRVRQANVFIGLLDGSPVEGSQAAIENFLRANPSSEASPPIPFYCQTPACAEGEAQLDSQSNIVFAAALLVGPACFSACDDFVSIFRDNGIAATIGQPSAAGDAPYSYDTELPLEGGRVAQVHLTVGVSFRPGSPDVPLQGHPAVIDVPLPPTAENRGRYVAEALSRARF